MADVRIWVTPRPSRSGARAYALVRDGVVQRSVVGFIDEWAGAPAEEFHSAALAAGMSPTWEDMPEMAPLVVGERVDPMVFRRER